MDIQKIEERRVFAIRIAAMDDNREVGHARLYVLYNDAHEQPFGLLEYLVVDESMRGKGIGTKLLESLIVEARERNCYKLIATSRYERAHVHEWYTKVGFKNYGVEFRMDL